MRESILERRESGAEISPHRFHVEVCNADTITGIEVGPIESRYAADPSCPPK